MKILVTGGNGFVGRNLVEYLLANNYDVLCPTSADLDLTRADAVAKYLSLHEIGCIIHCATVRRIGTDYPLNTCELNLRMFFNLNKYKKPSTRLINFGSGSEYDRAYWREKMSEEYFGKHIPQDGHSYAKYLISKFIMETDEENLICLRLFGVFGKYEDYRYKFISNSIVKNLLNMPIIINQNVIYDYLYIADLFPIIEHFVNNDTTTKHKVFNVTATKSVDLVSLANIINAISDYKSEVVVLNQGIGVNYSGDNRKLLSEMGNFQFVGNEAAISDLRRYYIEIFKSLDAAAVQKDAYLGYAKELYSSYFSKNNEK